MIGSVVVMMQESPQVKVKGGRVFGRACRVAPRKVFACCCETPKHSVASGAPRFLLQRFPGLRFQGPSPPSGSIGRRRSTLSAPPWPGRAVAAVNNSVVSNVFEIITSLALHYSCRILIPFPKQERRRLASKACPGLTLRPPSPSLLPTSPAYATNSTSLSSFTAPASIPTSPPAGCGIVSCE